MNEASDDAMNDPAFWARLQLYAHMARSKAVTELSQMQQRRAELERQVADFDKALKLLARNERRAHGMQNGGVDA